MKTLKMIGMVALMLFVAVPLVGAQVTWDSSFTVVNMGTETATVTVTFYEETGTERAPTCLGEVSGSCILTNPFTLTAGKSQIVYLPIVPEAQLPANRYSVVVSADQPIVAIANLVGDASGIGYNGSYGGAEDMGQTMISLPSVNKNFYGWNSNLSAQNLTGSAMDITVNFYAGTTSAIYTTSSNVPAYASWNIDVSALPADVPDNYNGSAVFSAAGPIAAVDNQTNPLGLTQDYSGFINGAMTLYCPALYKEFYTWNSSLNVQNVGTASTDVLVEYSDGMTATATLGPNAANLFYQPAETHTLDTFSAKVTADQPLVAIVNAANPVNQAQTYNCFDTGATGWYVPIVEKNFYGWDSGVQVMNIGTAAADITITYETPGCSSTQNVAAGASAIFYTPGEACLDPGYGASAALSSLQPFVVIVNQTLPANQTGDMGDWSMSYNGFQQ